jgi:hypothetical protein
MDVQKKEYLKYGFQVTKRRICRKATSEETEKFPLVTIVTLTGACLG